MALTDLGIDYRGLRRFEEAIDCYQQSLAIFRETGDRHHEGMAGTELGNAYQGLGRFGRPSTVTRNRWPSLGRPATGTARA